ncbi:protein indeterminate-domain 1 isoform X1 [Brachypodium distachyon]|uniref:C2H2-type domain-containing protein n=1 Tax=Brachypodium distachyon TaxID=15368 RepID=A0A0Q3JRS5_BRADI|nr:protein indeterminate-domain 1 isoform X1 [Brachypodium distachyon]KQK14738.1 hypothetical protein BRADI_1g18370v3 [Brachypodium distachyon]KQK14744.1 hypothetical protein BRADI_1g18370v3 [Brachypodium distachyon]KQK14745.1 hypothetical protein BRADI_1g18370v3 [Brachypodium distachyon]KQK14746.1 hypothetical protein BRADI_1g18370v3 [Brachypodium distachyon]KQK14747.1 hypothetical protein BRADI_1g18370v3 [Brachypodium distachyon]|eukprot:XP_010234246.2 protein indeterminate-domain 1 isoform X1 [Brachypodium distachyon]
MLPNPPEPQPAEATAPAKKKRNLPGTPDPDAEVIALSPGTLMASNRFVCEVCGKGFQRDQNLQLHRRGHNLPWRLRQPGGAAPRRRRVYVCPDPGCVHHSPARALGDLTGIKKHFCRKHGEKRWACPRCGKRYAVQADLKAHAKACGTREYRCGCGTLFTRRDSFTTHRSFCGALGEETSRVLAVPEQPSPRPPDLEELEQNVDKDKENGEDNVDTDQENENEENSGEEKNDNSTVAEVNEPRHAEEEAVMEGSHCILSPPSPLPKEQQPRVEVVPDVDEAQVVVEPIVDVKQEEEDKPNDDVCFQEAYQYDCDELKDSNLPDDVVPMLPCFLPLRSDAIGTDGSSTSCGTVSSASNSIAPATTTTSTFAGLFASATTSTTPQSRSLRDLIGVDPTFLCLAIGASSSLFPETSASNACTFAPPPAPHMSATALLQKAAEVGASQSSSSFLKGFGLASSSSSTPSREPQGRSIDSSTQSQLPQGFIDNSTPFEQSPRIFIDNSLPSNLPQGRFFDNTKLSSLPEGKFFDNSPPCNLPQGMSASYSPPSKLPLGQFIDNSSLPKLPQERHFDSSSLRKLPQGRYIDRLPPSMLPKGRNIGSSPPCNLQQGRFFDDRAQQRHHQSNQLMDMDPEPILPRSPGLAYNSASPRLPDLMMAQSPLFGPKPVTQDFLGLGIRRTMGDFATNGGLPALMVGGELNVKSSQVPPPWEEAKRKSNGHTI